MKTFFLSRLFHCSLSLASKKSGSKTKMPFYAVAKGLKPGIYATWPECQAQIAGFKGARYKKFPTMTEAKEFVQEHSGKNPIIDRRSESEKSENVTSFSYDVEEQREVASTSEDGSMSPTLLRMKKKMQKLQKELSELRTKFDQYISNKHGPVMVDQTRGLHTSSSAAEKRNHPDTDEEDGFGRKKLAVGNDKTRFATDNDGFLIVYTDGACENNGRYGAQAGVGVFFGHGHPMNVSEPVRGRPTNNMAEIQAATYAVELAHASGFKKVAVHTDSQFMINCMTSWLKGWKKKNWVKSDGQPVKNKEELIALDQACEGLMVKWVHVRGHAGNEGNEEADRLARQGAKLYKSSGASIIDDIYD